MRSPLLTETSLAGALKQLRWSSDCGRGPGDCSRRTDQQWQKPDGCTCRLGAVYMQWYVVGVFLRHRVYLQALMSLFVLASKDGWVNIMYTGLDAVGVDQQVFVMLCLVC